MGSERGIIIVGNCRAGKRAATQQVLKERPVLVGVDFADMTSAVLSLNMSFKKSAIQAKKLNDAMLDFKSITPDRIPSLRDDFLRNEAMKLRSFQEDLKTIVYEKPQSKFISRPRNNFRKR